MPDATAVQPVSSTLSADQLHLRAREAHRVGNKGRLVLIQVFRILEESRSYHRLGFPSLVAYSSKTFGYRRAQTRESVRVARALDHLPRCVESFANGEITWTALREISRVANAQTEEQWLKLAAEETAERLNAEVRVAREQHRDAPRNRKEGYSMPALNPDLQGAVERLRVREAATGAGPFWAAGRREARPGECDLRTGSAFSGGTVAGGGR